MRRIGALAKTFCTPAAASTSPAAEALVAGCQAAWTHFARHGDPSGAPLGAWPPYGAERNTMRLGAHPGLSQDFQGAERRAWEAIGNPAVGRL